MAIALRNPITAKVDDRASFLRTLLEEYPRFLNEWENSTEEEYLLNVMKMVALKNTFSQTNSISSLNLSGKVKKIQTAVFMIVCSK